MGCELYLTWTWTPSTSVAYWCKLTVNLAGTDEVDLRVLEHWLSVMSHCCESEDPSIRISDGFRLRNSARVWVFHWQFPVSFFRLILCTTDHRKSHVFLHVNLLQWPRKVIRHLSHTLKCMQVIVLDTKHHSTWHTQINDDGPLPFLSHIYTNISFFIAFCRLFSLSNIFSLE